MSEQLAHVSLTETGGGIGHRDGPLSWDRLVDGDPSYSAGFDALGNAQLQMESLLADGAGGYTYSTGAGSYLDDGALLLGHLGEHASASILPAFAANVAVEVQLSIRDFGPDETHWVGIQFRSFDFGVGRGYMVYLRATGQVEVQSPEGSIWSVGTVPFERGQWVTLRVAIVGTRMLVEVPGLGKRELRGLNYVGPGRTALQSYWVAGAFRAVKVWLL